MSLWPHQEYGINSIVSAIEKGYKKILLTTPTGGGKTKQATELLHRFTSEQLTSILYTNRRMLTEQTYRVMKQAGIDVGVRASGWQEPADDLSVYLSTVQTEHARVIRKKSHSLCDAERVLIDEAHIQTGPSVRKLLDYHNAEGSVYIGFTATPLNLEELYEILIVAGTNSELRKCGALVPCLHYGPDEPDTKGINVPEGEDFTEQQLREVMMREGIFGRVLNNWKMINPEQWPTLLFAPGVAESIYFAEEFTKAGIPAAHIDGENVWLDGQFYESNRDMRQQIADASRDGIIKVVCNRFVLREGIDWPWLRVGIAATLFGSLQSYLQSGGRLLRAYPGKENALFIDHGGNWWRHGSLNEDRIWKLEYTNRIVTGLRNEAMRSKKQKEPFRCPQCSMIVREKNCPCGFKIEKKSRPVVQSDGTVKELNGDIFRPRRVNKSPDGQDIWKKMYYRSRTRRGAKTFAQAMALYARENNWQWPDRNWPLMPRNDIDLFAHVADVPRERLR